MFVEVLNSSMACKETSQKLDYHIKFWLHNTWKECQLEYKYPDRVSGCSLTSTADTASECLKKTQLLLISYH